MTSHLTVTIPTFNRPDYIQRQVRSVLRQLRDNVELVVYDNCSDIPVSTLFSDEELKRFKINRGNVNIGGDANICKCLLENSNGWVWLLGDDDKISDDAIEIILNIIEKHLDCCYINFGNKRTQETRGYLEFLDYMKIVGAFGISFFQSACVFNMERLHPYIRFYYEFLSSWVGQIALVIKYLQINKEEHCYFTEEKIVVENPAGGWSHLDLIINSTILIDKFHDQRQAMKNTLFKGLGDMYFTILAQINNISIKQRAYYLSYIVFKLGLFRVLRYNTVTILEFILSCFVPSSVYNRIRTYCANKYNKQILR